MVHELIDFLFRHNMITIIFYKILYMTVVGSMVGILVLAIRKIFDTKITPKWKCILWGIFIISLLIPYRFEVKSNLEYQSEIISNLESIKKIPNVEHEEEIHQEDGEILNSSLLVSDLLNQEVNESIQDNIHLSNQKQYSLKDILLLIIIPYTWLLFASIFILSFIVGCFSINKKIKNNKCDDVIINNIFRNCLKDFNIKNNIKVYYQDYKKSTSIFGIFNTKVLISKDVLKLKDEELKYVFFHELSHFMRKDLILNSIMLFVVSIHFFNPVVWYMFKRIREDMELAADEYAINKMNKNEIKQYGLTLIHMLELNQTNDYAINYLCMSDTEKNMERRIKMIKKPLNNKLFSEIFVIIIIALIFITVFIKLSDKETIIDTVGQKIEILSEDYEHLWSEPKEISSYEEYLEMGKWSMGETVFEVSDEEKSQLISVEKAKEIGQEIIEKIGFKDEIISSANVYKNYNEISHYTYVIKTKNGLELWLNAEDGKFIRFDYDDLIKQKFENDDIKDEELKTVCLNLYNNFDFLDRNYEFYTAIKTTFAHGEGNPDSPNHKQYTNRFYTATFYEKQPSGILNQYKVIYVAFSIVEGKTVIKSLVFRDEQIAKEYYLSEKYIFEDNEIKISEDTAVQIAKEKDKSLSNNTIKTVSTELINNSINYYVWQCENGLTYKDLSYEKIEGKTTTSYPRYYYDKYYIRNTYEVKLIYDIKDKIYPELDNGDLGRVYYIDVTTGEILGGRNLEYSHDIVTESDYLFDEDDNYTVSKLYFYDKKTKVKLYEYEYDLSEEMKSKFYIEKDEEVNPVSYNIY